MRERLSERLGSVALGLVPLGSGQKGRFSKEMNLVDPSSTGIETPSSGGFASAADRAACREMILHGSKSFYSASLLLPAAVREGAYAIYGFCRLSDDEIDLADSAEGLARLARVKRLEERLNAAYAGTPHNHFVDRCLADTVAETALPIEAPLALLEGLRWDAEGRCYENLEALSAYGIRVAGSVGVMMAALMGVRREDLLARACDLGVAMQYTNICRDIGEDARSGRFYLPLDWAEAAGLDVEAFLENPEATPTVRALTRRLLREADRLYGRADGGIAGLPLACRPAIFAARYLYAEIGREVARRDYDSVSSRAVVSKPRKIALLGHAGVSALTALRAAPAKSMETAEALVAAVAHPEPGAGDTADGDFIRVIELFERLERRGKAPTRFAPAPAE